MASDDVVRTVQVSGVGRADSTPDVVRVSLRLSCDGDEVAAALRAVGGRVEQIGQAVRDHGVASRDVQSLGADVHPRYDRDGQHVVGYQAGHRLSVVVRDVDSVGAVIEALAAVAGNSLSVDSIQLDLSDTSGLHRNARTAAFADAKDKAQQYAALAGAVLGEVQTVVEGAARGPVGARPLARAYGEVAASSSMPVEAGEQSVTATVTAVWALHAAAPLETPQQPPGE